MDPDEASPWTRAHFQLKLKPEEIGQFVSRRGNPPLHSSLQLVEARSLRPDPATHARRNTQPLHKRSNLIFICMTSERTNQPPAEAFSPTALGTKVKLCLRRGAYQLADIKRTYRLEQTISPAGNSNILMWLLRASLAFKLRILFFTVGLIWLFFFPLLMNSIGPGSHEPHRETAVCR